MAIPLRIFALIMVLSAAPALAGSQLSQLERGAQYQLRAFGYEEVDVRDLTTAQKAQIFLIGNSKRSHGDKRALIASALGGSYSIFGSRF